MSGIRENVGKTPYHLISPHAMKLLADVLGYGAGKYAPHNWVKGLKWEEGVVGSLERHLSAWKTGEENDPETGLPHAAHILCNAMFLAHFVATGTGTDDRAFKLKEEKECPEYTITVWPPDQEYSETATGISMMMEAQAARELHRQKGLEALQDRVMKGLLGLLSDTSPTKDV